MPARRISQPTTANSAGKLRGRAFKYARELMLDPASAGLLIGRAPFSHIDTETVAQRAYTDGYRAALKELRSKWHLGDLTREDFEA